MFVCLCNGLREREIAREIDRGASSVPDIFEALACEPKCCACVPEIRAACEQRSTLTAREVA